MVFFVLLLRKCLLHVLCCLLCYCSCRKTFKQPFTDFFKTGVLKNFAIFTGKYLCRSFFNKVAGLKACIFIKEETTTQAFSCEYCEIFKNSFFIEHLFIIIFLNVVMIEIRYFRVIFYHCKISHVTERTSR